MRLLIKKILKKHKYFPENQQDAIDTVIKQCEMWWDNAKL